MKNKPFHLPTINGLSEEGGKENILSVSSDHPARGRCYEAKGASRASPGEIANAQNLKMRL